MIDTGSSYYNVYTFEWHLFLVMFDCWNQSQNRPLNSQSNRIEIRISYSQFYLSELVSWIMA